MPLSRPLLLALFVTIALTCAHAEEITEIPAQATEVDPAWLPSARNIKIELAPATPSVPNTPIADTPVENTPIESVPVESIPIENVPPPAITQASTPQPESLANPAEGGEIASPADGVISDNPSEFVPPTEEVSAEPPPVWTPREEPPEDATAVSSEPTESISDSLWTRIRSGFVMREFDSNLIGRHEEW